MEVGGGGCLFYCPGRRPDGSQAGSEPAEASSQWFDRGASPLQTPQIAGSITAASADLSDTLHGGRLNQPPSRRAGVIAVASESFVKYCGSHTSGHLGASGVTARNS